ncbi:MAG: antirestriction protein ArdA, partial [Eggerthellaceae bacterium]|nr:antirestriction protein ArdA [Eggerthellaceae bacterium]
MATFAHIGHPPAAFPIHLGQLSLAGPSTNSTPPTVRGRSAMGGIAVCIGNYGTYNNGYLIDRWVDLPMDPGDLAHLLHDMEFENRDIGAGEEFYVSDYDGTPFGIGYGSRGPFSEYTPIESLNLLAQVMEDHPRECGIVQMALDSGCDCPESVLGLANWILQADDIPVYAYGLDPDVFSATSPEEKMGYSWAVESGLYG